MTRVGDHIRIAIAVAYHLVTLRWLLAPRWKDKSEARTELRRLAAAESERPYSYWTEHIEKTRRLEFTTAGGTWYQAIVRRMWDDQPGGAIREFVCIDGSGRGAYSPLCETILVIRLTGVSG